MQCHVAKVAVGYYITFPQNLSAGLLLTTIDEKAQFAKDCGLNNTDDLSQIVNCPEHYYQHACTFKETPF